MDADLAFEYLAEMREEWRSIPGFPGYTASSFGRVRSLYCLGSKRSGKVMATHREKNGYYSLLLYRDKRCHKKAIHRIVCETFCGPPKPRLFACHYDDNKNNNRASNLRWDSAKNNCRDRERNGKRRK